MANQHHPSKQAVTYWLDKEQIARLNAEAKRRTEVEGRPVYPVDLIRAGIDLILSPGAADVRMSIRGPGRS